MLLEGLHCCTRTGLRYSTYVSLRRIGRFPAVQCNYDLVYLQMVELLELQLGSNLLQTTSLSTAARLQFKLPDQRMRIHITPGPICAAQCGALLHHKFVEIHSNAFHDSMRVQVVILT